MRYPDIPTSTNEGELVKKTAFEQLAKP